MSIKSIINFIIIRNEGIKTTSIIFVIIKRITDPVHFSMKKFLYFILTCLNALLSYIWYTSIKLHISPLNYTRPHWGTHLYWATCIPIELHTSLISYTYLQYELHTSPVSYMYSYLLHMSMELLTSPMNYSYPQLTTLIPNELLISPINYIYPQWATLIPNELHLSPTGHTSPMSYTYPQ